MFNVLVTGDTTAWEVDRLMSLSLLRLQEYSGSDYKAAGISLNNGGALKILEACPTLLLYEITGRDTPATNVVRYGFMKNLQFNGSLTFSFQNKMYCERDLLVKYARHLGIDGNEFYRTHWAIKDGDIPDEVLRQMTDGPYKTYRYEVSLSYAGEDEAYVKAVAEALKKNNVEVFYAPFNEADMWGRDMIEYLDEVYRKDSRFCVMFISKHYKAKAWPTHEKRSAMARAVQQMGRYLLPCRFDKTDLPGLSPSINYEDLTESNKSKKTPAQLADKIGEVLAKRR
jgi:hypothetical protein